jgi:hypothetical protein
MNEAHVIPGLNQLVVVETTDGKLVELVRPQESRLVEVVTTGPQGPAGVLGGINNIEDVDVVSAIDGSLLYYDGGSSTFRADSNVTKTTLTDGGNF